MFNTLRLSIEALVEILLEVLADVTAEIINRTELDIQVKIQQLKKLKVFNSLKLSIVLLLVVYCWDSLKN